jgi:hypothetical protein
MNFNGNEQRDWDSEFEDFFIHWEKEVEALKEHSLGLEECCKISKEFYRDWDGLLVRRPLGLNELSLERFEQLDNKLNSALAMICSCSKQSQID